jgi:hypothetical protein
MDSLWLVLFIFPGGSAHSMLRIGPVPPGVWYIECHTPISLQLLFFLFHDAEQGLPRHPEDSVEYETDQPSRRPESSSG